MYDLIIIGSGPAGLSAAVYAKRAGLNTLVLEKSPMSGGQVLTTYEVDNYLGLPGINGFDLGMKFREHADNLGVEFMEAEVLNIDVEGKTAENIKSEESYMAETFETERTAAEVTAAEITASEISEEKATPGLPASEAYDTQIAAAGSVQNTVSCDTRRISTDKGYFDTKSLLIATGAIHSKLGVPGEEELAGMGVSYCATCDGAFFKNRTVAVIGGGDVAVEDAIFLARTSKKVYLVHRREELRAAKILQESLNRLPNVEILWNMVVDEIAGTDQVEGLRLRNVKSGEIKELDTDGVFIAVGIHPNSEKFKGIVECDKKGYIIAGEDGVTGTPGIFAAGDVRTKPLRQIITAVSDGANAVISIQDYFITK